MCPAPVRTRSRSTGSRNAMSPAAAMSLPSVGLVARLRLDITWPQLALGAVACVTAGGIEHRTARIERGFGPGDGLVAYSVRSAFDAYLSEVGWPRGSEILVSALTIPHMVRIIEHHGYRPVAVDLDPATLLPTPDVLGRAISPRTVAWLHAHLFGTRTDLSEHGAICRRSGIVVIEDCAQAYDGHAFHGSPESDVAMFSFGTIKTTTALGGAIVRIRDKDVRDRVRARMGGWPVEARRRRFAKVVKCAGLQAMSSSVAYAIAWTWLARSGRDADAWIHESVRGFPAADLQSAIRRRPSAALLALLERRLARDTSARIGARARRAEAIARRLPGRIQVLGDRCPVRTHWILAVVVSDPAAVCRRLRAGGFDATARSSLTVVGGDGAHRVAPAASAAVAGLVYLPTHAGTTEQLVDLLTTADRDARGSEVCVGG